METMFAPSTDRPPCARKRLWKRSTIVQITGSDPWSETEGREAGSGRVGTAPGTEGSFRDERIKMNPPVTPSRGSASPVGFEDLFQLVYPEHQTRDGNNPPHQAPLPW